MNGIFRFLRKHKWLTLSAGSLYFASTVIFHKVVANLSLDIEKKVTYTSYNNGWGLFAILCLSSLLVAVIIKIFKSRDRGFKILFLVLTAGVIAASHVVVLAVNLEYIHIIQFSLLVIPVFALSMRFGETVFWTGLLGAVDELYQYYVVWWPNQSYFDFNDITMDVAGGVFMIFLISVWLEEDIYFSARRNQRKAWNRSPAPFIAAAIVSLSLAAWASGFLRFHPQTGGSAARRAVILLSKDPPAPQFWSEFEKGKIYHIQGAAEWMAVLFLFTSLYTVLDWRFYRRKNRAGVPG